MLVVISQHFKYQFPQRKSVFKSFEIFEFRWIPNADNVSIDGPNDVVEEITEKCHKMFHDYDNFEIERLLRFDIFDDWGKLVNPF